MKATKLLIERYSLGDVQTIGNLHALSESGSEVFSCDTLELPWLNNQKNISCIPVGKYKVVKRYSKKYGNHLHVTDVENRTWILIHAGNYLDEILGCILVGKLGYVNSDDVIDVGSSRKTLKKLINNLDFADGFVELEIINR